LISVFIGVLISGLVGSLISGFTGILISGLTGSLMSDLISVLMLVRLGPVGSLISGLMTGSGSLMKVLIAGGGGVLMTVVLFTVALGRSNLMVCTTPVPLIGADPLARS